ncbi:MAG: PQQ-binding-like beta-propeller repeat protein [Ignavibacterium sp.]|jgi:outer membrane protein assembly factor BamB/Icc-related predicted phosphoesterase|nr:PQQ-binding-like beta-propeller repeat protein [Ignavibacterium sp.]
MKKFLLLFLLFSTLIFSQNFQFAWLSDIHVGNLISEEDLKRSVIDINAQKNIQFTIISGDITADGALSDLIIAKNNLDMLNKPYYIIPGNHEAKWSESGCTDFAKLWGYERFVFEFDKFLFIGLYEGPLMRMADGHFSPQDLRWLDSVINNMPDIDKPIIFVTHYPLDQSIANWYEMTNRLKKINTQIVFCGHGHKNEVFDFESIPGVMCRSNLRGNQETGGYNLVEVKDDSVFFYEKNPGNEKKLWHSLLLKQRDFDKNLPEPTRPDYSINSVYPNIKSVWKINTGYTIGSSATVTDKSVFAGDVSGTFYSINISNGNIQWKYKTDNAIYSTSAVSSSFVVFGSVDSNIYCLNTNDGKLNWKFKTNAAVMGCPVIIDDIVYIVGSDKVFRALDLKNGKLIWQFTGLNGFVETKPTFYDNKILFGAWDENFYCLSADDGQLLWKWNGGRKGKLYSPAVCWAVVSDDVVFIAAPDRQLTAIDISTGNNLWRTGKYQVRETIGISENSKSIYVRTFNDSIISIPALKYLQEPNWIADCKFGYDISSAQIVEKDGAVFYATKNGMIFSLSPLTGKINWQHKFSNGFINTITAISNKKIIVTDFDGAISLIEDID